MLIVLSNGIHHFCPRTSHRWVLRLAILHPGILLEHFLPRFFVRASDCLIHGSTYRRALFILEAVPELGWSAEKHTRRQIGLGEIHPSEDASEVETVKKFIRDLRRPHKKRLSLTQQPNPVQGTSSAPRKALRRSLPLFRSRIHLLERNKNFSGKTREQIAQALANKTRSELIDVIYSPQRSSPTSRRRRSRSRSGMTKRTVLADIHAGHSTGSTTSALEIRFTVSASGVNVWRNSFRIIVTPSENRSKPQ